MSGVYREIAGFYEVGNSKYEVDPVRAQLVFNAAANIMSSNLISAVVITPVKGIRIPVSDDPLSIDRYKAPTDNPHTILLTGRHTLFDNGGRGSGHASWDQKGHITENSKILSTAYLPHKDVGGAVSVGIAVHEMGHVFKDDTEHCKDKQCIMQPADGAAFASVAGVIQRVTVRQAVLW